MRHVDDQLAISHGIQGGYPADLCRCPGQQAFLLGICRFGFSLQLEVTIPPEVHACICYADRPAAFIQGQDGLQLFN